MTESHRENLSAGIDGELSKEELRFLLRRLDHDADLLDAWSRHWVARDGLRRELPALASPGFAGRVMLAIDQVSVVQGIADPREGRRSRHWLRWSAGGAIAAGVAAAALMVSQPTGDSGPRRATPQVASAASSPRPHAAAALASVRQAAPMAAPSAPAAVPPWLGIGDASQLSERASMTLGGPSSDPMRPYRVRRYQTLDNGDGSYLLLIDPAQAAGNRAPRAAAGQ